LESKVCQEEYNLAKCLFEDPNYTTELVEVKIEHIKNWPKWCSSDNKSNLTKVTAARLDRIVALLDQDRFKNRGTYMLFYH